MTTTETENQILAELHRRDPHTDGELFHWREIRRQIDGTYWGQIEAANALMLQGDVALIKVGGATLIGLNEFGRAHPARPIAV